jgi:hypothetical protein
MAYGWRGEGLSNEGEPERMSGRADSIGRTYQDDSERSSRRKANEAETGPGKDSGLCRIRHKPDHVGLWIMSDSCALSLSRPKSAGVWTLSNPT